MKWRAAFVVVAMSAGALGCTEDDDGQPDGGSDGAIVLDGGDGMDATARLDAGDAASEARPDASDGGACPPSEKPDCCCEGDHIESPFCSDGGWKCPGLFDPYFEPTCSTLSGPCSSPPLVDAGDGGCVPYDEPDCCCEGGSITSDSPACIDGDWYCPAGQEEEYEPYCSSDGGPCAASPDHDAGAADGGDAST